MKILVTGGAGFIGSFIVRELIKEGHDVSILIRRTTKLWRVKNFLERGLIGKIIGDINNPSTLRGKFKGFDAIIHAAGMFHHKKEGLVLRTLAFGSKNVFSEALSSNVERVIHISSAFVTAYADRIVSENDPFNPTKNEYGYGKVLSEKIAREYIKLGLHIVIIRPGMVYGPLDERGWAQFFRLVMNRYLPIGIGSPNAKINPVYISDLASAVVKAIDKGKNGEAYLIAGDEIVDIKSIYLLLRGYEAAMYLPYTLLRSTMLSLRRSKLSVPYIDPENLRILYEGMLFSNKKAKRELSWRPKVKIKEGLKITMKWLRMRKR